MKSITDTKKIKLYSKIGQYTSLGALVVLGLGLWTSFQYPTQMTYSYIALLVGFILMQVGIYFTKRWGRKPSPEEMIDKSMKGLGREFTLYNYVTPVSHLLIGPAGVWTILPNYQTGLVAYDKKRWRAKGGGFIQSYMRLFGQDNIGRPDLEAEAEVDSATRFLKRVLPAGTDIPQVRAVLLFVDPKVELKVEEAPIPALTPKSIKDFLREKSKEKPLGELTLSALRAVLPQPDQEE